MCLNQQITEKIGSFARSPLTKSKRAMAHLPWLDRENALSKRSAAMDIQWEFLQPGQAGREHL